MFINVLQYNHFKSETKFIKGVCFYTCVGLHTVCVSAGIHGKTCLGENSVSGFVT